MKLPLLGLAVSRTRTAFLDRSDKTLAQDGQSCHICCGRIFETCCQVRCSPGQTAYCYCQSVGGGLFDRCECV